MIRYLGRGALAALVASVTLVAPALGACPQSLPTAPLSIMTPRGPARFTVEVASTFKTRETGLMCRKTLAPDHGMLFDFKTSQQVAFWMKDTWIPLDMVFIGADGKIVSVARNAVPMDETPIPSEGPVLAVLEIAGGRADELGIAPGEQVQEQIFPH